MHISMRKHTAVTDRLVNKTTNEVWGGGIREVSGSHPAPTYTTLPILPYHILPHPILLNPILPSHTQSCPSCSTPPYLTPPHPDTLHPASTCSKPHYPTPSCLPHTAPTNPTLLHPTPSYQPLPHPSPSCLLQFHHSPTPVYLPRLYSATCGPQTCFTSSLSQPSGYSKQPAPILRPVTYKQ